jgi:hypothetical protein
LYYYNRRKFEKDLRKKYIEKFKEIANKDEVIDDNYVKD